MGQQGSQLLRKGVTKPATSHATSPSHNLMCGTYAIQGYRPTMEDQDICEFGIWKNDPETGVFFVLDGHGSDAAAKAAKTLLPQALRRHLDTLPNNVENTPEFTTRITEAVKRAFIETDDNLRTQLGWLPDDPESEAQESGTTAVGVLVLLRHLVIINLGDSRALLARRQHLAFETHDHKPSDIPERQRIEAGGGFVAGDRVCAVLGVSRALGDFMFKDPEDPPEEHLVTCVPDVTVLRRDESDEFVVLACDGVYDVLRSKTVASLVREALLRESSLVEVAGAVVKDAFHRRSSDNISVLVLCFPGAERLQEVSEMIDDMFSGIGERSSRLLNSGSQHKATAADAAGAKQRKQGQEEDEKKREKQLAKAQQRKPRKEQKQTKERKRRSLRGKQRQQPAEAVVRTKEASDQKLLHLQQPQQGERQEQGHHHHHHQHHHHAPNDDESDLHNDPDHKHHHHERHHHHHHQHDDDNHHHHHQRSDASDDKGRTGGEAPHSEPKGHHHHHRHRHHHQDDHGPQNEAGGSGKEGAQQANAAVRAPHELSAEGELQLKAPRNERRRKLPHHPRPQLAEVFHLQEEDATRPQDMDV